jgi:hypothetical protein
MTRFNDADAPTKNEYIRIINQRWRQLHTSEKENKKGTPSLTAVRQAKVPGQSEPGALGAGTFC